MKIESRLSNKICPDNMSVEEWQVALRQENARDARFTVEHLDNNRIWGDYLVSSNTGRYRIAFRGVRSDRNFCSCLDFRTNGLGTCKHLEAVSLHLQESVAGYPWAGMTYNPPYSSIYVSYKGGRSVRMRVGEQYIDQYIQIRKQYFDEQGILPEANYPLLQEICRRCSAISSDFRCYEDVQDFVSERVSVLRTREELELTYPEKVIPWNRIDANPELQHIEGLLYNLCYRGYGLIVGHRHPIFIHLIARLIEEVYIGEEDICPGYVVVETDVEVHQWQSIFAQYQELQQLPVSVVSADQFTHISNGEHPLCSFVYVDNAEPIKEWKNAVSLAIKRVPVRHLYMRVETLRKFTPVQLSSVLQHISPFVIGPFYKFIHTYRPIFPLYDDGSNMPEELVRFTFLCSDLHRESSVPSIVPQEHYPASDLVISASAEEKVDAFLHLLREVLADTESTEALRQRLAKL